MQIHDGLFKSKGEINRIETRVFAEPKTTSNSLRPRTKFAETQPPKIVVKEHDGQKRIVEQLERAPQNTFEPFDAKAFMNYKFRDTQKSQWKTKRGCVVAMKAPDMPLKEFRMN